MLFSSPLFGHGPSRLLALVRSARRAVEDRKRRFHEVQGSPTDRKTCCNPREGLSGHPKRLDSTESPSAFSRARRRSWV